ncbi:MAG: thioredoxin domain-containing protein [Acidimicrobiales bacterium]
MNRLADETSPYLRQHADNPVDWYPWGDEAFEAARRADKPILLSVGYSACHWCHVMAHESFEDADTAAIMNELVVSVKVDREERPDVDAIYMEAVQAMTGQGGWPMTVFLMPDGRPFFGGTYFPKAARGNMLSFTDLLRRIDDVWRTRRDDLVSQADDLTESIARGSQLPTREDIPGPDVLDGTYASLAAQFDPAWGGFGQAPKFPQTMSLEFLLRAHAHNRSPETLAMVTTSLDAMASGGIYDHVGGAFARYSVDERWLVPHFEKMLYDQALLARVYLHAWQVTGEARYRQVLDETIEYVARDLRHRGGGFYSAEDADSLDPEGHAEEGRFYTWSLAELDEILGPLTDVAAAWWGVTEGGNFEGRTILHRPGRGDLVRPPDAARARRELFDEREGRPRPGLDDKVLTEWNGLMLATLAEAAHATGNHGWLVDAVQTAEFLLAHLRRADGRWLRSWQAGTDLGDGATGHGGRAQHLAYAADYGALLDAFTRLAEATGEARWVDEARKVADDLVDLFWDDEHGGVFTTGRDAEALVTRPKDLMDNATPSANSLAAVGLLRLAGLTGDDRHTERAAAILRLLAEPATRHPMAFGHLLAALDLWNSGTTEIAIVGDRPDLVRAVAERYRPNAVLAWGQPYPSPLWDDRDPGPDGAGQAYVCRDFACQRPVGTVAELGDQLGDRPGD